mmetsp:Transcript_13273/g.27520  ORF Transcript_13273/g.27520 Transcript_13273/m.27520 type:complete len:127 (+) Transcript_13273:605-985(+)
MGNTEAWVSPMNLSITVRKWRSMYGMKPLFVRMWSPKMELLSGYSNPEDTKLWTTRSLFLYDTTVNFKDVSIYDWQNISLLAKRQQWSTTYRKPIYRKPRILKYDELWSSVNSTGGRRDATLTSSL